MDELNLWRGKVLESLKNKTRPQQRLLRPFDLKRLADERGIWVAEDHLESWDKQGIFHPLLRVRYPFTHHRAKVGDEWPGWEGEPIEGESSESEGIVTVIGEWSPYAVNEEKSGEHPAVVEASNVPNFIPWRDYQQPGGRWGRVDIGTVYYHPYQIFRLSRVARGCQSRISFIDFTASNDSTKYIRQSLEGWRRSLADSEVYELKVLFLLLTIEDRYLPSLRGLRHLLHLTGFGFEAEPKQWFELQKSFDASHALSELPFSIEEIKAIRENLARTGHDLDPNRIWFELIRHIPHERRQRLRDKALLAWDYYEAAEIIGQFLREATGEPQPHVDDLLHDEHWKKALYGVAAEDFDYETGNALQAILAHYNIDPRLKVLLIIEGESEDEYIRVWCDEQGLNLPALGVRIFNTHGIPGGDDKRIRQVIKAARQEEAAVIIVMDNENKAREKLQKWLDEGLIRRIFTMADLNDRNHPIGGMVWEPCFEEANFSPDELILALSDLLSSRPQQNSVDASQLKAEVEKAFDALAQEAATDSQTQVSWFRAMQRAGWRLGFSLQRSDKPDLAACLARRFSKTERPIHRLIYHVHSCAILSAAYGPADPTGGYGRPDN